MCAFNKNICNRLHASVYNKINTNTGKSSLVAIVGQVCLRLQHS